MDELIIDEDFDADAFESYLDDLDEGILSTVGNIVAPGLGGLVGSGLERGIGSLTGRSRRPSRTRRVSTGKGRGYFATPKSNAAASQRQLKEALDRVGQDVKKNATAIKAVTDKINEFSNRLDGQVAVNVSQKKAIEKLQSGVKSASQSQLMFSLMDSGKHEYTITENPTGGYKKDGVLKVKEKKDTLTMMLPFLMGGGLDGDGDNNMMMMALAMAMSNK